MTRPGGYVASEVVTASNMNLLPGGYYGHAATGTIQTPITTIVAVTTLSVALTAVASRRYEISAVVNIRQNTTAGTVTLELVKAGTTVLTSTEVTLAADTIGTLPIVWNEVPGSGSVTYSLRAKTSAGSLSINPRGSSTIASIIRVSDVGV